MQKMMTRVGAGVSKKAAIAVEDAWRAANTATLKGDGTVWIDNNDWLVIHRYLEACAKKVGVI